MTHINSIHEGIKGFNFHLICSASKDENILLCLEYVIGSPMVTHQVNCVVASFCNILNEFFLQFTSNILTVSVCLTEGTMNEANCRICHFTSTMPLQIHRLPKPNLCLFWFSFHLRHHMAAVTASPIKCQHQSETSTSNSISTCFL